MRFEMASMCRGCVRSVTRCSMRASVGSSGLGSACVCERDGEKVRGVSTKRANN